MSKWITKQTFLFFLLCFGGTYLMGILLGCAYLMGYDTSVFARTQMLYPAAAVIISLFITKKNETLPTRFFQSYLIITGLAILCLVIGVVTKTQWWTSLASVCIYGGSLWGIWHLPLEIFYYFSPEVSGWGVLNRQIVCISIGVFFAYAYMRTKNIWVPIILHYMNNNLAWFFNVNAANTELSPLLAVVESVVPSMIVFLPFIFTRVFSANNDSKETVT